MIYTQVLNTKGAAKRLGCTISWVHKLVSTGKLKAYVYDSDGALMEHKPDDKRQGQGLYFFINDLDAYQPRVRRRPRRSQKMEQSY